MIGSSAPSVCIQLYWGCRNMSRPRTCKWWLDRTAMQPRAFSLLRGNRACLWCGSSYTIRIKVRRPFGSEDMTSWSSSVMALIGLVTLNFDLSNSKWGHGSPVSYGLDPSCQICSLLSVLDLGSGTGQTDGQTTAINAQCPPYGGGA